MFARIWGNGLNATGGQLPSFGYLFSKEDRQETLMPDPGNRSAPDALASTDFMAVWEQGASAKS